MSKPNDVIIKPNRLTLTFIVLESCLCAEICGNVQVLTESINLHMWEINCALIW